MLVLYKDDYFLLLYRFKPIFIWVLSVNIFNLDISIFQLPQTFSFTMSMYTSIITGAAFSNILSVIMELDGLLLFLYFFNLVRDRNLTLEVLATV